MAALEAHAAKSEVPLLLAPLVDTLPGTEDAAVTIGLEGEHHAQNAAVAVALCNAWILRHEGRCTLPNQSPDSLLCP
jgi:hypothetical protein|eukprot:COSAG06_NODE_8984_length_2018_cov_1.639917_2_plen_77_part_00